MNTTIDLSGVWKVALDAERSGIKQRWWERTFTTEIRLPGTTDEAKLGEFVDERCEDRLSRVWRWIGPAWYQRTVVIDPALAGKKMFLFLERTKDSQVWVDGQWVGSDDSLSTPHRFDLSRQLTPGEHTITVLVDNAKLPPVGPCHQVDERTQTNWNGILGRIELQVREPIYIRSLQAYPNLKPDNVPNPNDDEPIDLGLKQGQTTIEIVAELVNDTPWSGKGEFTFTTQVVAGQEKFAIPVVEAGTLVKHGTQIIKARLILPAGLPQWDEFNPALLRITMQVRAMPVAHWVGDSLTITCGLRSFAACRGQFVINDRHTFLRGKNDCALFPITGYAPMDKEYWLRHLRIAADYGVNHLRFHSWCPPEAAFAAADELGIYLQVELPNKRGITHPQNRNYTPPAKAYETLDELKGDAGDPEVRTAYLTREGERILAAFGNHPSFVMMTLGNEIGGDEAVMRKMCDHFRSLDARHLYAMGTNHFHWDVKQRPGDEFWVIKQTIEGRPIRGASWEARGHIDHEPPSTMKDYSESLRGVSVPVVGHEVTQFEVYPNYAEIEKYTGVLRARNLEIFRERLKQAGMFDQAMDFHRASGLLSVVCRKEDIEAQIRTPGFGGFQLLDIQDFSGQGTALIGILDVFMDAKGLIPPEKWREFCCETVPLLRMKKLTWTDNEDIRGCVQVAHYGPTDLRDQLVNWSLRDGEKIVATGSCKSDLLRTGEVNHVDLIHTPLRAITSPRKLTLTLELLGTKYRNTYEVWVYPSQIDTASPPEVTVSREWSDQVRQKLEAGGSVLLMPEPRNLRHSVEMAFQTGFWSPMFRIKGRPNPITGGETPGTQGILLDPNHPLFRDFPTEFHANWQWWQLVKHSRAMVLDSLPRSCHPIVQVIDGFDRNHKLGLILEARVGKGRLLLCSIDLPTLMDHPEARQLLACIHRYMTDAAFSPTQTLTLEDLQSLV